MTLPTTFPGDCSEGPIANPAPSFAEWLDGGDYVSQYRGRAFSPCGACPAREQATAALMERHRELRRSACPARVRLLLIAESPPWSAAGAAVRHFYNSASPHPDNLFRATAAALLDEDRTRWSPAEKGAALARLAAGGFLLLDGAKCPVNHLPPRPKRAAVALCAGGVLREELIRVPFAPHPVICMVVRSTVPAAALPVLADLGLARYVVEPEGLPFPGRWADHRARFIAALRHIHAGNPFP